MSKVFPPETRIDEMFSGKAITFITDKQGHPVTLFIGKRQADGSIKGERYVRRLTFGPDGVTPVSSHWEAKGKVTRS
ncbi:MAG: hypothetical protein ACO1OQ_01940 [Rufibacter sp.]